MRSSAQNNDLYQFTMAYGYYLSGKHNQHAVFDCFYRKGPFGGQFAIAAGLRSAV